MGKFLHKMLSVDIETRTGICQHCGPVALKRKAKPNGYVHWACSVSENRWHEPTKNLRAKRREVSWRKIRELMLAKQDGVCAICEAIPEVPHLDHCHMTGTIRGVLCRNCNIGLGNFRDDPTLLAKAIEYLR